MLGTFEQFAGDSKASRVGERKMVEAGTRDLPRILWRGV